MRPIALLCIASIVACGDSTAESLSDGQSGSSTMNLDPTDTGGPTPTSTDGSATDSADTGSASDSADTGTTVDVPTTSPVETGTETGTGTGETGDTSGTGETGETGETGDTSGTTGMPAMCDPMPEFPAEVVPLNEMCEVELQIGSFNPSIEWKYGTLSYAGPA